MHGYVADSLSVIFKSNHHFDSDLKPTMSLPLVAAYPMKFMKLTSIRIL